MIKLLSFFFVGILIGLLVKKKIKFGSLIEKLTNTSVYLLLFYLGVSVGLNKMIVGNLHQIGLKALIITLFSIFFSLICSSIIYKLFFKKEKVAQNDEE